MGFEFQLIVQSLDDFTLDIRLGFCSFFPLRVGIKPDYFHQLAIVKLI